MLSIFKKRNKTTDIAITNVEFSVVDTELTGLNLARDQIIAIGCIKMKGKTIKMGEIFYRTVKPQSEVKKDSIVIHELTPSELEGCPNITPILKEFLSFTKDSIIVGHFITVDLDFLKKEIYKNLRIKYKPIAVDTLVLYRWLIKKGLLPDIFLRSTSLRDVASSFNINSEKIHNAIVDAFITAQIFQRILSYLFELKITNLRLLLDIGSLEAWYKEAKDICYQL
ncbi:PolC-type DNA polymerase III [Candidatus Caldatribacterium sp.]|uniref:3'-5' exonuclease n=1 Tax=Candidatus Caldatribacterium sp. TaxID=2282143 RepID=UPI0038737B8A